jgi:hypothetical protein
VSQQEEPISYNEATEWLRIGDSGQIGPLLTVISAVREEAEDITRRLFVQREATAAWDEFYKSVDLPRPPVSSVSTVEYYDRDTDTWETVGVGDYDVRGRHLKLDGRNEGQPLQVTYTCGYADLPPGLKQQLLRDIRYSYDHRDPGHSGSERIQDRSAYRKYRPY